jgi:putative ABC transport system permease protein
MSALMRDGREFRPAALVAALVSTFGSVLVIAPGVVTTALDRTPYGGVDVVQDVLAVIGVVFLGVALFVGAVVTANTCSTIIAGRRRVLALQRLIGATGAQLRAGITRIGLLVGVMGGLIGTIVGVGLCSAAVAALRNIGFLPGGGYPILPWQVALPALAVVLTTWAAFRVGSRSVLSVAPLEAMSSDVEQPYGPSVANRKRRTAAVVLGTIGLCLIMLALSGRETPLAALPAMLGCFSTFTAVIIAAPIIVPPLLRLVGRVGSPDPSVLIAARNTLQSPERSSRTTMALVIGVTLLTTFSAAFHIVQRGAERAFSGAEGITQDDLNQLTGFFSILNTVVSVLVGFAAIIAGVGVVNALSLGIGQRRQELALLRVIGMTGAQIRRMVIAEALQMVVTAVISGLAFGTIFGWIGATTMLGALHILAGPALPLTTVGIIVAGAALLTLVATVAPIRSALRATPTDALRME